MTAKALLGAASDGTAVPAGYVGEVLVGTATTAWTITDANLASVSLPAGSWMVSANSYVGADSANRFIALAVSSVSNSVNGATQDNGRQVYAAFNTSGGVGMAILPPVLFTLSATTTIYSVGYTSSISGSSSPKHRIQAVRIA